jgi:hypothetical protein
MLVTPLRPRLQHARASLVGSGLVLLTIAGIATAFFDEVLALRAELAQWEAVHADADFSDLLEQLDDIAGTVFTDVSDDAWFAPYVTSLAEWGIVSGYRDAAGRTTGRFGPGESVTVAEILKMAAESARIDESACSAPRRPEAAGHWAAAYVGCAEVRGARVLAPDYSASLNRAATRAEVLAVMHDLFGDEVPSVYATYDDVAGHRFESDVAYASLLKVVSGDTNAAGNTMGTFRPDDPVNRAEAAKILVLRIKERARQEVI